MFEKGDKVRDIYTDEVFIVKRSYLQDYAGKPDQTVLFEPTDTQPTPWNKGRNLELIEKAKSVFTDLKEAGIPTDHHESDLYCLRTDAAIEIIRRYGHTFSFFTSQIDGKMWIEIPFAFDPFWEKKAHRG